MQWFKEKFKKPLQGVQLVAIVAVFILACVRLAESTSVFDVLALLMSIASFFSIIYQFLAQNIAKYMHLGTPKIYFFINASELSLWMIIMIIGIATNMSKCTGGSGKGTSHCTIFLAISSIAGIYISQPMSYNMTLYWRAWRAARRQPHIEDNPIVGSRQSNELAQHALPPSPPTSYTATNTHNLSYPDQPPKSAHSHSDGRYDSSSTQPQHHPWRNEAG
ncbi:hypothetical protein V3481_015280 [Fusarium oxysporum f. sp. vasinfectum]